MLEDLTGKTIKSYHILESIGQGGAGAVYRANQLTPPEREVAIKALLAGAGPPARLHPTLRG